MRRAALGGLAIGIGLVVALSGPAPAFAHALLASSDPKAGANLSTPPATVTITFTEAPDPSLSTIRVLDSSGASVTAGASSGVPGQPRQLSVALQPLGPGVYTVAWRTLSTVDGHLAAGSFAFGVGVTPPAGSASGAGGVVSTGSGTDVNLSFTALAGRWFLYLGLILLVGCGLVGSLLYRVPGTASTWLVLLAWVAAAAGTLLVSGSQIANAGVDLGAALQSSLGRALLLRLVPIGLGGVVLLGRLLPLRRPRLLLVGLGLVGAGGMLADALASHAAAGSGVLLAVAEQWVHVLGSGVWIGGLAALLAGLYRSAPVDRAIAARRFSRIAVGGIAIVAGTGALRAISEVGTWSALVSTDYGRIVIAKSGVLLVLAILGAVNHFRNVPAARRSIRGLRLTGSGELLLATGVLALTALLVNLAPPGTAAAQAGPSAQPLVVTGSDFGTTLRATLTVSPGTAGFNAFDLGLTDYDTGAPLGDRTVTLRFAIPARPDVGGSTLALEAIPVAGHYQATGANLSLDGTWRVTALVAGGPRAVEVAMEVKTVTATPSIDVNAVPGLPTLYTVHLGAGNTVQIYLDPGTAGANELHATFFDPAGNELPVPTAEMSIGPKGGALEALDPRRLELGHFIADTTLDAGTYTISVTGAAPGGQQLTAQLDIPVTP